MLTGPPPKFHGTRGILLYSAWEALRIQGRDDVALLVGTNCFVRLGYEDAKTMQKRVGGVILN